MQGIRTFLRLWAWLLPLWLAPPNAEAAPASGPVPNSIEAGAPENFFYIKPGYSGSSIMLSGSIDREKLRGKPFDVAVTIRGPVKPVTVWKKDRYAGMWINSESMTFENVPDFYALLSTRPARDIARLNSRLFRIHIHLPASAAPGLYRAEFYIHQKGKTVGKTGADIQLSKVGIEHQLPEAVLDFPWLYGIAAVMIAALTGGGASPIFRKT